MNCVYCEERMSDYLEQTLSPTERHAMDLHIQSCAACNELMDGMTGVLQWARSFPKHAAPASLPTGILASTPPYSLFDCAHCEERMSDYLEHMLDAPERAVMAFHLESCGGCSALHAGMTQVVDWGRGFPVYEAPAWLPTRILANTPHIERETWIDTLTAIGRWFIEPRTAMALFTSVLMIGWVGNLLGVSPDVVTAVRNPAAIYYGAGDMLNRAYDDAVRSFYHAPLVTQIQSQIERLREIS